MISAFLTSMAGTFYAQYILYIDPESVMIMPFFGSDRAGGHAGRGEHGIGAGNRGGHPDPAFRVQPCLVGL